MDQFFVARPSRVFFAQSPAVNATKSFVNPAPGTSRHFWWVRKLRCIVEIWCSQFASAATPTRLSASATGACLSGTEHTHSRSIRLFNKSLKIQTPFNEYYKYRRARACVSWAYVCYKKKRGYRMWISTRLKRCNLDYINFLLSYRHVCVNSVRINLFL